MVALFIRPGKFDTFKPDVLVEDQQSLKDYGLEATVLHLLGHTKGSIGILTAEKAFFCGDLMSSMGKPSLEFFVDDMAAAEAGVQRLRNLGLDLPRARQAVPAQLSQRRPVSCRTCTCNS